MKKQLFFNQLNTGKKFYYGNEPDRLFLKVTDIHALLVADDPTKKDEYHTVNPLTLIFTEDETGGTQ